MPCLVGGILHGLAIDRQGIVLQPPGLIPGIECPIQRPRFNAYQAIANDEFAGNEIMSVLAPAAEALACLLSQAIGPIEHGLVTAHAAQDSARRNAQHHRQAMASPLSAA